MKRIFLLVAIIFLLAGCSSAYEDAVAQAEAQMKSGDFEGALDSYNLALEEKPDSPEIREQVALIKDYETLEEHVANSEWEEASDLAQDMLENDAIAPSLEKEVHDLLETAENGQEEEDDIITELNEIRTLINQNNVADASSKLNQLKSTIDTDAFDDDIKDLEQQLEDAKERVAEQEEREKEREAEKQRMEEEAKQRAVEQARQRAAVTEPKRPTVETSSLQQKYLDKAFALNDNMMNKALELYGEELPPAGFFGEYYQEWDDLLNEVWSVLKDTMPADEFESLKADQNKWIQKKEENFNNMSDETASERAAGMDYLAHETADRTYYLIELLD